MAAERKLSCNFEVFGTVQKVFFRKYTEKQAKTLGVRGWCMNTNDGTVKGQLEGYEDKINKMKNWLQTRGSPNSKIEKVVFSEAKELQAFTFPSFVIKR